MQEGWANIELKFFDGTDWSTVGAMLSRMTDYNLQLKARGQAARDIRLLESAAFHGDYPNMQGGIAFVPIAEDGEPVPDAPEEFMSYEDIESLGIY